MIATRWEFFKTGTSSLTFPFTCSCTGINENGILSLNLTDFSTNTKYYITYIPLLWSGFGLTIPGDTLTGGKLISFDNVYLPYRYDLPDYILYPTDQLGNVPWSKEFYNDGRGTFNKTYLEQIGFDCL